MWHQLPTGLTSWRSYPQTGDKTPMRDTVATWSAGSETWREKWKWTEGGSCSKSRFSELLCLACAMLSCSVMSDSLRPHELWPSMLLYPWGFSRQEYWSRGSSQPRDRTHVSCIAGRFFLPYKPSQKRDCKWNWVKVRLFDQRPSPWPLKALEFLFALLSLLFLDFPRTSEG